MANTYGHYLEPTRTKRIGLGIKARRNYEVINHHPDSVKPGETLFVKTPQLEKNCLIVPNSVKLTFKVTQTPAAAELVANVGRNIVEQITTRLGGREINQTRSAHVYNTYRDLWLSKQERKNATLQGIDKSQRQGAAKKDALVTAFGARYCIPLDFALFNDHMPFYSTAVAESLDYEITFNAAKYVVGGEVEDRTYEVTEIRLEYETIYSTELADEVENMYTSGHMWYVDNIQ